MKKECQVKLYIGVAIAVAIAYVVVVANFGVRCDKEVSRYIVCPDDSNECTPYLPREIKVIYK